MIVNTLKTAAVVVLLLGVLFGVYKVLNQPEDDHAQEAEWQEHGGELEISMGQMADPTQLTPYDPTADPNGIPVFPPPPTAMSQLDNPAAPPSFSGGAAQADFQPPGSPASGAQLQPPPLAVASFNDPSDPSGAFQPQAGMMETAQPGDNQPTASGAVDTEVTQVDLPSQLQQAREEIEAGKPAEALRRLTVYYNSPDLTSEEHDILLQWLNLLAGKVVYSTEHTLEAPYVTQQGDTLDNIAAIYEVPAQLLYNINAEAIGDPRTLAPQTELKVIRGPFFARVDLNKGKLSLFVQQHFAGEFSVDVGQQPTPRPGKYTVMDKLDWLDQQNPQSPYGHWHLQISGDGMAIHGASETAGAGAGCISLDPADAADVFAILSRNSKVEIMR